MGVDTVANLFAYGDNMGRKFRQKLSTNPSKNRVPFLCYHRCKFICLRGRQRVPILMLTS